jgi:cytidyltransferase-like protein
MAGFIHVIVELVKEYGKTVRNPVVITFGTFDRLNVGHLSLLEQAARHGPLVVGVSCEELSLRKHDAYPVNDCRSRAKIVAALRCVEKVFIEESHELRKDYIASHKAEILVLKPKWKGCFDSLGRCCQILYYC